LGSGVPLADKATPSVKRKERKKKIGLGQEAAAMGEFAGTFLFPNRIGSRGHVALELGS
jgi:hypothetical protein